MLDTFDSGGEGRDKIEKWKKRSDHFFDERKRQADYFHFAIVHYLAMFQIIWDIFKVGR